jgi:coenzyme F420-0:L-glutamate ligase
VNFVRLYALRTGIVKIGQDITELIQESLEAENLVLEDGDVLALASKIVALAEGRIVKLSDLEPSEKAKELARMFSLRPEFAQLILQETDKIYGGVKKALLTLKSGILTANAGVDNKNVPEDHAVLWPKCAEEEAKRLREELFDRTGRRVAVMIIDSGLVPLRLGTKGLALAVAGLKPVIDLRREKDIFGKPIIITRHSVADDLASAAHLLMGEGAEKIPIVLIKDAPIVSDEGTYGPAEMMIPPEKCIFINALRPSSKPQKLRS